MSGSESLMMEAGGKIALPESIRDRYHLSPETPLRLIETRHGILLVPLTGEPMSETLAAELAEWQSLGAESLAMFPYEDQEA
jgi:bifunctional DNA-binding transcriptional regulator/antitoxin component of YhaV-PrlF toxin-antitoxin module